MVDLGAAAKTLSTLFHIAGAIYKSGGNGLEVNIVTPQNGNGVDVNLNSTNDNNKPVNLYKATGLLALCTASIVGTGYGVIAGLSYIAPIRVHHTIEDKSQPITLPTISTNGIDRQCR
ncbi:MAG: hypothetical protein ACK5WY_02345 [Holosporaceae bacterium]|jgi:hypothetical protein|nr:hypothetical protein [Rhodospirillaceae bacterium]